MTISKAQAVVGLIGAILVIGTPLWVSMKNDAKWQGSINEKIGSQETVFKSAMESNEDLLDAKLGPIADALNDLQREMRVTQSNVEAMEVTTTQGADANARLLAGRITLIQEELIELREHQDLYSSQVKDSISTLWNKLSQIEQLTLEPIVIRDTLEVEKEGGGFLGIKNLFN